MSENKEHLNIDLEFLDKKEPLRVSQKATEESHSSKKTSDKPESKKTFVDRKYNWKNILIVGGIILFFGWAIFSGSDSSTGTNSSDLVTQGGQTFRCSDSNYNRALQLKPSQSVAAQLTSESNILESQIASSKAEKAAIDAMYVDESNEYEVDNYNARVDRYNTERQRLMNAASSWDQRQKAFDNQIDTYNNFLDANCTPQ